MQNYKSNAMPYGNYRQPMSKTVVNEGGNSRNTCDVRDIVDTLKDMSLAMAYVPWQKWRNIYDAEKALCNGTIFQELNLPFHGVGGCQK